MRVRIKYSGKYVSEYSPMINYFNRLNDKDFKEAITLFSKDCGFGIDYYSCSFASNWHPLEDGYFESGVQFVDSSGGNERKVIVDYATFYKFLKMACDDYLEDHPEEQNKVEEALKTIRDRYNI
ncbi:ribonuclease toxin immunity protein CdiI [Acetivibrio clariflavus]|uniref:CDI immunity protein domain-containing protein n=1 Tax=Acetivibrio clariflavus (strain DSM 19732 / NBRC 101661 / EBR45) TaxID=720554 RepID=G8LSF1_ACECE|nr:ribonuclease toxin immunity protein CdiI [Acetivibrio clariflavus]AEV68255.1 hypothetical protein Clocl_1628 [Acetivibrio clariflavus DSM 19732]